jgi:hypothetical protein
MESKNEPTEELCMLIKMQRHIELHINYITEINNFKSYFLNNEKEKMSPFINSFLEKYSKKELLFVNNNTNLLIEYLNEIRHQIKATCSHIYYEDEIENLDGNLQKITYCQLCYSSF